MPGLKGGEPCLAMSAGPKGSAKAAMDELSLPARTTVLSGDDMPLPASLRSLCGLAVTEAERTMPALLDGLRAALTRHGLLARAPVFRVTGCANGCARPYSAELALVGQAAGKYAVFAGGGAQGDRLAFEVRQKVAEADLPGVFERLVAAWAEGGLEGEAFGDFAARLGPGALAAALEVA